MGTKIIALSEIAGYSLQFKKHFITNEANGRITRIDSFVIPNAVRNLTTSSDERFLVTLGMTKEGNSWSLRCLFVGRDFFQKLVE